MNNLYIAYDKFPCQYYLTTFFVISTLVSPRILSISLRNVLSRLFSHEKTHDMCLLAYMLLHTVFSPLPAYQLPRCVFSLVLPWKNTRHVFFHLLICFYTQFSLCYLPISFRNVFSRTAKTPRDWGIPNAWRFINSKLILPFQLKGIHCRSTGAGTKVQSSSLLPRLQHRSRQSQPETSQSQAPYP